MTKTVTKSAAKASTPSTTEPDHDDDDIFDAEFVSLPDGLEKRDDQKGCEKKDRNLLGKETTKGAIR
jgi:hypothetical protein